MYMCFHDHDRCLSTRIYCFLGLAPLYVDPNNITPEGVDRTDPEDLMEGEFVAFPKAYFCEVRADWKFMKDSSKSRVRVFSIFIQF